MSALKLANAMDQPTLRVVVNRSDDGEILADHGLTLREAIALINGTLLIQESKIIK